jgi:hypothetical protein
MRVKCILHDGNFEIQTRERNFVVKGYRCCLQCWFRIPGIDGVYNVGVDSMMAINRKWTTYDNYYC